MRNLYRLPAVLILVLGLALGAIAQTSSQPQPPPQTDNQRGMANNAPQAQGQSGTSVEDELQLSADQRQKIADILRDENRQVMSLRDDATLNDAQKEAKFQSIREEGGQRIKVLLTPEQLQKLAVIQERIRRQHEQEMQQQPNRPESPQQPRL